MCFVQKNVPKVEDFLNDDEKLSNINSQIYYTQMQEIVDAPEGESPDEQILVEVHFYTEKANKKKGK